MPESGTEGKQKRHRLLFWQQKEQTSPSLLSATPQHGKQDSSHITF